MYRHEIKEIGGYYELELNQGEALYSDLISVNSARNALVYLIMAKDIKAIHLPYYNCRVVADAVQHFCPNTKIHYYHVDSTFRPIKLNIQNYEYLYYVNYYGFQEQTIQELGEYQIVIDNAQAFYSSPISFGDAIYCPRKFFGVCDGGYLSTNIALNRPLEIDISWDNSFYMLKRIDCGSSAAYSDFRAASQRLVGRPLRKMSRLTERILSSLDYGSVKKRRKKNFMTLHKFLSLKNRLTDSLERINNICDYVPFCYPLFVENASPLRRYLIDNKVYIPVYWPELLSSACLNEYEADFVNNIVCIPIDQRYDCNDMEYVFQLIKKYSK